MFERFLGRRVLLLQGPVGPFFAALGRGFGLLGIHALKVNLNAADAWYSRGVVSVGYRGTFEGWPAYLRRLIKEGRFDTILMFGDSRPYHRAAGLVARELGVEAYYFEEGYLRPDYVTLELGGTNFISKIPKSRAYFLAQDLPPAPTPEHVGNTFFAAAWYAIVYAVILAYFSRGYPAYQHHRHWAPVRQAGTWWLSFGRKWYYAVRERRLLGEVLSNQAGFFLVPLQVYDDYQVRNSRFASVEEFIREVAEAFRVSAPADTLLVFKHHPRDRGHRDYALYLAAIARELGLEGRFRYVHDVHLPPLLKGARGTVVINSTVGISSLYHGTPVKCLDDSVYLACSAEQSLEAFFRNPARVERRLVSRYIRWLKHNVQFNGSFYLMRFWTPDAQRQLRELPIQENDINSSDWNVGASRSP